MFKEADTIPFYWGTWVAVAVVLTVPTAVCLFMPSSQVDSKQNVTGLYSHFRTHATPGITPWQEYMSLLISVAAKLSHLLLTKQGRFKTVGKSSWTYSTLGKFPLRISCLPFKSSFIQGFPLYSYAEMVFILLIWPIWVRAKTFKLGKRSKFTLSWRYFVDNTHRRLVIYTTTFGLTLELEQLTGNQHWVTG